MRTEGPDSSPVYILFNDFWGPVEVELSLLEDVNVLAEPQLPARFVVPGQTEKILVGIGALDPRKGFQYRLQLASVPGRPMPELVRNMVIDPPFSAASSFYISQGFNGTETHNTPDSTYAIDIVMPIGTTVIAARDGVVMDVEEDFNRGGTDLQKFADKANHVRILHDDGTMALYAHLDLASVQVRAGGRVRAGQPIARSGNTGFSTGPHLHFVIQQNVGMQMQSVPFSLNQPEGRVIVPNGPQLISGTLPGG
jgi:murein DD-endopeptidase MepM/ murein hydrolase activator NlpD